MRPRIRMKLLRAHRSMEIEICVRMVSKGNTAREDLLRCAAHYLWWCTRAVRANEKKMLALICHIFNRIYFYNNFFFLYKTNDN